MDEISFDYEGFHSLLLDATRKAFLDVQLRHTQEIFYIFALYTTEEFSSLHPSANTEEGLTRTALVYFDVVKNRQITLPYSLEEKRLELRYSIADWSYHLCDYGIEAFQTVNEMMATANNWDKKLAQDAIRKHKTLLRKICHQVLKQLDSEGFFGVHNDREKIVISFIEEGQSDLEQLGFVKSLNPLSCCQRYSDEVLQGRQISKLISEWRRAN